MLIKCVEKLFRTQYECRLRWRPESGPDDIANVNEMYISRGSIFLKASDGKIGISFLIILIVFILSLNDRH